MNDTFKSLIESAKDFLILLPKEGTVDDFASGLSLYLSLVASGKKVTISTESEITAQYSRLIGIDKITKDLGNKNLSIKFLDYNPSDVDKVSYDIENGQFMLTVTPKAGLSAPRTDQVYIDYNGTTAEFVFLVGGTNDTDFPFLTSKGYESETKLIHVGKSLLNTEDSNLQVLSYSRTASSVSEVLTKLLVDNTLPIDQDIATNLISGIENGSDNFQADEVTVSTFELFTHLLKLGGTRMKKNVENNFPQGSIPNVPYTQPVEQTLNQPQNDVTPVITDRQMTPEEAEEELNQEIPPAWSEPKIFTGTSVS